MEVIQNILIFFIIFALVSGLMGFYFYKNYLKQISCLAISYLNLIVILVIFAKSSEKSSQLFDILTTILILFSITLITGIGIISNIARLKENKK